MASPSPESRARGLWHALLALPLALWMGLVLALCLPLPSLLAGAVGVLVPSAGLAVLVRGPRMRGWACFLGLFAVVLGGYLALRPSNRREWMPDVAQIPSAAIEGERLTVRHVRNCFYRSEFEYEPRFEDRTYDLRSLQGMDLFLVSWGPRHIAHTILSFDFGSGGHLAFSIETRKERHETYSALRGFFREYEVCIVAGDERDLIRLRTNHRREQVRRYRLVTPTEGPRLLLEDYLARLNGLAERPEWYNALTANCTTAILGPIRRHTRRLPWSWKLVASGHLDEYLYDQGFLDRSLPFPQLRERALINEQAEKADQDPAFSLRIREGR
jgi:hypothetical protein